MSESTPEVTETSLTGSEADDFKAWLASAGLDVPAEGRAEIVINGGQTEIVTFS